MRAATVKQDVKVQLEAFRRIGRSFKEDPKNARRWLIRMGILDKSGKTLASRYR